MTGELTIHVVSAGKGESVIVELPNGSWGVVDCYTRSIADDSKNLTIMFLRQHNVRSLEFVCITHPHADHYRGLNQLLKGFEVKYFWRFGAFIDRDLFKLTTYFEEAAIDDDNEEGDADQLTEAFHTAYYKHEKGYIKKIFRLHDDMRIYPLQAGPNPDFQISTIAPSADQITEYEKGLARCFDSSGRLSHELSHQRHNDVSVALLIRYGETRVILCGDVEAAGWSETLELFRPEDLKAHGIKVSHHGSATGYTVDLWRYFSASGKRVHAVVAPFRQFGLPKREALEHILSHGVVLLTTCRGATLGGDSPAFDFWDTPDYGRLALYKSRYRRWLADRDQDDVGLCSLVFDRDGNCTPYCTGDACAISRRELHKAAR